jgi:hypothetical protein
MWVKIPVKSEGSIFISYPVSPIEDLAAAGKGL